MSIQKETVGLEVQINKIITTLLLLSLLITGCSKKTPTGEDENKTGQKASLIAVGDNIMHQLLLDEANDGNAYDFSSYYGNIAQYIQGYDLACVNQETILGGESLRYRGYPLFNTPDQIAYDLKDVGFNVFSAATNHSYDLGFAAIQNSVKVFKEIKDVSYLGVYDNEDDYNSVTTVTKNGLTFALLNYTQLSNQTIDVTYSVDRFDETKMKRDIENAKEISDFIIVFAHWGLEYGSEVTDFQKKYATFFNEQGVDVVIGAHTHVVQPVEWLESDGHKTLVAYGLGNFVHGMMEEETQLGMMLSLEFEKNDGVKSITNTKVIPIVNHYRIRSLGDAYGTRYGFTAYRLKDYTDDLAAQHGLNGYEGITIDASRMRTRITNVIGNSIDIEM